MFRTDVNPDSREAPSPQVGWGHYKEEHPDEYRTPVKEENFNWNMEMDNDNFRGRGGRNNGRFGRRKQDWDQRGGMRGGGRGGWNQDRWTNGRGQNGPPPFMGGRGGARSQNFGQFMPGQGGVPDFNTTSPEMIRKQVIPYLVKMGEEGKRSGTLNETQYRDIMNQV